MLIQNSHFVHLHCHSEFSNLDGLAPLKKLVFKAREMGFPALAITDHGNVSSAIKLINYSQAEKDKDGQPLKFPKIKPIIGSEMYLTQDIGVKNKDARREHIVLLAKNFEGYRNLCTLSQISWLEGFYAKPRIDWALLQKYNNGLICSTACVNGIVNKLLLNGKDTEAKDAASKLKSIFGEDFFLEIQFHGMVLESILIPKIFKLSSEIDVPIICTNDVHYLKQSEAKYHEVLMCAQTGKCIYSPGHLKLPYDQFYFKSAQEMEQIFNFAPAVLYNTYAVAERVDFDDIRRNLFGGMRLPKFDIPKEFADTIEYLEFLAWEGMKRVKWDKSQKHIDQLKKELNDIRIAKESNNFDFAKYFLIEWDIINHARKNKILTGCGRGSVFASVLARTLGITYGPDPLQFPTLWERFLGFDLIAFMKEEDFGFEKEGTESDIALVVDDEDEIENIEIADDPGGVFRY
jgi:DNA polymerase-3 subunit alpha